MRAAAGQHELLVVKFIVISWQIFHADEAFDGVLQRDKQAERGHAGYFGVKVLADEGFHIGRKIQLVDVALGRIGGKFARCRLGGGFLAEDRVRAGILLAGDGLEQHTVGHQVGIASDGRSEVQVFVHLQAVVSQALWVIARTGHGAQQQGGQSALARVAFGPV